MLLRDHEEGDSGMHMRIDWFIVYQVLIVLSAFLIGCLVGALTL